MTGKLPIPVTVLLEGEEESGGVNLPPFLDANLDELRADIALICDTNMWDAATPAITTSLRGLCGEEIVIHAADRDLHSGFYGSAAANPNHVLARILADLHDADGRVTLARLLRRRAGAARGAEARAGRSSTSTRRRSSARSASRCPAGEKGRSVLEMTWSRPTAEVNGMGGGYQGAGFKTVIPAEAHAKVSFRLVFDQDPHKVRAAFREHVQARHPGGLLGRVPRARLGDRGRLRHGGAGVPEDARRAHRRVGQGRRLRRRRRLDPGDDADQGEARRRRGDGRASASPTTASTARTRSTSSRASTRASAPGRAILAAFSEQMASYNPCSHCMREHAPGTRCHADGPDRPGGHWRGAAAATAAA